MLDMKNPTAKAVGFFISAQCLPEQHQQHSRGELKIRKSTLGVLFLLRGVSLGPPVPGICLRKWADSERSKTIAPKGLVLLLLLVDAVSLGDWVELFGFVLLTWVLLVLVVETGVVGMAFANAILVADRHHLDK